MGATKDVRQYLRKLRQDGYDVTPVAGRSKVHFRISLDGRLVATAGGGQDWRTLKNLQGEVKRNSGKD
jgi:hypothetical protein